jgi:hypothetical protein
LANESAAREIEGSGGNGAGPSGAASGFGGDFSFGGGAGAGGDGNTFNNRRLNRSFNRRPSLLVDGPGGRVGHFSLTLFF